MVSKLDSSAIVRVEWCKCQVLDSPEMLAEVVTKTGRVSVETCQR